MSATLSNPVVPLTADQIYNMLGDAAGRSYPADGDLVMRLIAKLVAPVWDQGSADYVSPTKYGAIGNGINDDTAAFLLAAEEAYTRNRTLYIPEPSVFWRLSQTIPVYSNMRILGEGDSSLIRWFGGDAPVIARYNWQDRSAGGVNRVFIRNINIDDFTSNPSRPTNYTIDLSNGDYHTVQGIQISGRFIGTPSDKYGLITGKHPDGTYTGTTWVVTISGCSFQRCSVVVNTTDSFILGCELYGLGRDFALQLGGGNIVSHCNFIGGRTYGAIYIFSPEGDTIFAVKVVGCQFDGNNSNDTAYGIYAPDSQKIISCNLGSACHMWNHNNEFIYLGNARACLVAGGVYRQGDAENQGLPDIRVKGYDNTIGPNTHYRSNTYPKPDPGGTRTNLNLPVIVEDVGGRNRVIPGTVSDDGNGFLSKSQAVQPTVSPTANVTMVDDFVGRALNTTLWTTFVGTDAECVAARPFSLSGGAVEMVCGDFTPASLADNGTQLNGAAVWRAQQDRLSFEATLRLGPVASIAICVGLTDEPSALEIPFTISGTTVTSFAVNAVCFVFDTAADTDVWQMCGVKANVDAVRQESGIAPVVGTYQTLRIELTEGGNARFFIDGSVVGTLMSNAVTATTLLCPIICAFSRNTATKQIVVDQINVSARRQF